MVNFVIKVSDLAWAKSIIIIIMTCFFIIIIIIIKFYFTNVNKSPLYT